MAGLFLNCLALRTGQPIGVERFARNVLGGATFDYPRIVCLTRRSVESVTAILGDGFVGRHPGLIHRRIPVERTLTRILVEMLLLPFLSWRSDVVFSVNNFGPLFGKPGQKRIVVVHDVWFMSEGYEGGRISKWLFNLLLRLQLKRSSTVVTVSDFSRQEIGRYFSLDAAQIPIVSNCLGQRVEPVAESARSSPPMLLLVGSDRPNKNVARALRGYIRFREANPDHEVRLVVVGRYPDGWIESVDSRLTPGYLGLEVRGFVSDAELWQLYGECHGVVFPSLYEGFGIPAIEALLRGRPLLISQDTACARIAGDLAIAVNGRSEEDIARGIQRLLGSRVDTDSPAFEEFRDRYMLCGDAVSDLERVLH